MTPDDLATTERMLARLAERARSLGERAVGARRDEEEAIGLLLSVLLDRYLREEDDWSPWRWVDPGLVDGFVLEAGPGRVDVHGVLTWLDRGAGGGFEPFAARIELTDDRQALRSLVLCFGSAAAGLGGERRSRVEIRPVEDPDWMFVFVEGEEGR